GFIWGSPAAHLQDKGWTLGGDVALYLEGTPLRGFFVKAHVAYESFTATLTYPAGATEASQDLTTAMLGAIAGTTIVVGPYEARDGGFIVSAGMGLGIATAKPVTLHAASPTRARDYVEATYFDGAGRLRLLGSLGLGAAF